MIIKRQKITSLIFIGLMTLPLYFVAIQPVFAQETEPFITMIFLAPTGNPVRVQHAQLVANELPKIGVGATLLLIGWDVLIPRLFEPSGSLALSYADGGYDMSVLGWSGNLIPNTQYWLFHSNFTPYPNHFGVQDPILDTLLELTVNTTDFAQRKQYIEDAWQYLTWQVQAEITLYQVENTVYMRDNVKGYSCDLRVPGPLGLAEMYFENGQSQGHGQRNEFVMVSTTRPNKYNDLIENDWYNRLAIGPLNHGLVERDSDYNFVPMLLTKLPYPVAIKNNHTGLESSLDPNWATVWEIELRDDVFWHEGYGYTMAAHEDILQVDADDVLFTFDLILDDAGPSPCTVRPGWQNLLGTNRSLAVIKKDRYHVQFHLQTRDFFYESKRSAADLFTYFEQCLFPHHILALGTIRADGSVAPIDYQHWATDDWNLGHRTGRYTGSAVIGTGSYILWPGENSSAQTVTETKNPYWHLKDEPDYANMFDKYIYRWITSKDAALNALEQAEIDLMDPQFHAEKDYPDIANKSGIFVRKILDWGCQTISINTAYGKNLSDLNVRLAISHMCPRQYMVDFLLEGLGQPAFMHFPIQNPFYPADIEPISYNFTRALEYMEAAGYNTSLLPQPSSGYNLFDIITIGLFSPPFPYAYLGILGIEVIIIIVLLVLIGKKKKSF
ncbi:MAG: ABC transporter substrate-binding protein [Promethearchaeota archaeon]